MELWPCVYLNDPATCCLQCVHLLPEGQGQLGSLGGTADVLAGEGPVQDGHRTCGEGGKSATVCSHSCGENKGLLLLAGCERHASAD